MVTLSGWIGFFIVVMFSIQQVRSGPCDGIQEVMSSERRKLAIQFKSSSHTNSYRLECYWQINGIQGETLYLTLNYLSIGDCTRSSLVIYEGTANNSKKMLNDTCRNITTDTSLSASEDGSALIRFISTDRSTTHGFKISFISNLEITQPFAVSNRGSVGVILAIVLGVLFLGSLFIAMTWIIVKSYYRCQKKEPKPSELTSITDLRQERIREEILTDDFDVSPGLTRGTFGSSSTQRIFVKDVNW